MELEEAISEFVSAFVDRVDGNGNPTTGVDVDVDDDESQNMRSLCVSHVTDVFDASARRSKSEKVTIKETLRKLDNLTEKLTVDCATRKASAVKKTAAAVLAVDLDGRTARTDSWKALYVLLNLANRHVQ